MRQFELFVVIHEKLIKDVSSAGSNMPARNLRQEEKQQLSIRVRKLIHSSSHSPIDLLKRLTRIGNLHTMKIPINYRCPLKKAKSQRDASFVKKKQFI